MFINTGLVVSLSIPFVFVASRDVKMGSITRINGKVQCEDTIAAIRHLNQIGIDTALGVVLTTPMVKITCLREGLRAEVVAYSKVQ